jgi:hypothetical protein
MARYEIGLYFEVDDNVPPSRKALHGALEHVRGIVVVARSIEEAESYADQVRVALIAQADK